MRNYFLKCVIVALGLCLGAADVMAKAEIPPIRKVTYQSKLSSEPVLVQKFEVNRPSADRVESAILKSAKGRSWDLTVLGEGEIQADLTHRGIESRLIFRFDEKAIEIHSISYKIDKTGKRIKREEPAGWIRNLHKDILANLGLI